jgi:hypothetical protein
MPDRRKGHLVDSKLSEALAPVLDDLRNSGGPIPDVRDAHWSNFPGQVTAMIPATPPAIHRIFGLASTVTGQSLKPRPETATERGCSSEPE